MQKKKNVIPQNCDKPTHKYTDHNTSQRYNDQACIQHLNLIMHGQDFDVKL